jgi:hypothetical protein
MSNNEMITGKINVKMIAKDKMFNAESGAVYLDVILIPTPDNQYGNDYMIVQSLSKEDREAGLKGAILGNAKFLKPKQADAPQAKPIDQGKPNDLPF